MSSDDYGIMTITMVLLWSKINAVCASIGSLRTRSVDHPKDGLPAGPGDMDEVDEHEPLEALRARAQRWVTKGWLALPEKLHQ